MNSDVIRRYLDSQPDERDLMDRAEEDAREQRWTAFVAWARAAIATEGFRPTVRAVAMAHTAAETPDHEWTRGYEGIQILIAFAETEGWSGVLSAIGRALREQEQDAAEVERRR